MPPDHEAEATERAVPGFAPVGLLAVLLISLFAWAPFLHPGFVHTHSGLGAAYNVLAARESAVLGWLPPYGTPGDGPLATWLLVFLQLMGVSPLTALRCLYAGGFVLSGIAMYVLARQLWGADAALIAAAVYMLIPYHLVVVYVRGSLAESVLLGLAPCLATALYEAMRCPRLRWLMATALCAAALALTHFGLTLPLACLLATLIWLVAPYGIDGARNVRSHPTASPRRPDFLSCCPAALAASFMGIGMLAGLVILLPAGHILVPSTAAWRDHFVYFFQLFAPTWGFGESVAGWRDEMPFQVGLVPLALAALAFLGRGDAETRRPREGERGKERDAGTLVVALLWGTLSVVVFLTLTVAEPVWRAVPLARLVAYPWQLLSLAALLLALLSGAAVRVLGGVQPSGVLLAVLLAAVVLGSYTYLSPRYMDASDLPDMTHPPLARLGEDILLLDARLDAQAQPGDTVHLTLIWQAIGRPPEDFTVFVHLLDENGVQRGQRDARPRDGSKPTTTWLPGEVVRDALAIQVAADATPGSYRVEVGMYHFPTLKRLPVSGMDTDKVVLGPVLVR